MIARSPVEILTVGTDPSLWDVMRSALGDEVALRSADGLQSALSVAAARPPDLLFVDVGPPPAEAGFSLASALRAAPAMAGLPLILFG
ncbi:MAG: hypothetical protein M3O01_16265, partial [Pseudomonadota bacterium]|nr:hypothetical protein [Pseudomonadota bacterium]